jgi:hypothetical protein
MARYGPSSRHDMSGLAKRDLSLSPGVYVLYRSGEPKYVGKAKCLQNRVWKNHGGRGLGMGTSAVRRNVAKHLGIAKAKDVKDGRHRITTGEAARVRAWLDGCEIAWRECADESRRQGDGGCDEARVPAFAHKALTRYSVGDGNSSVTFTALMNSATLYVSTYIVSPGRNQSVKTSHLPEFSAVATPL